MPGLIERYRDRLPFAPDDPVVSLTRARRRSCRAPRCREAVGAEVWLKLEGANPTGSFKDRGMTCAVSDAVRDGAEAVICASTGNTAASLAAYAARAGLGGAVIVPEGKIAAGKLAQALMHGARVIALRGNFDEALALVRELTRRHPIALVNSVNPLRLEGQKTAAFEILEELGEIDALCIPVGNAGNITAYWKGFGEVGHRAARCSASRPPGAAPLVRGRARREARDGGQRDPHRQPGALGGGDGGGDATRGGAIEAVTDDEILDAYRLLAAREGVFCEPASAASVAGLLATAPAARGASSACSPATGSRTRRRRSSSRARSCPASRSSAPSSGRSSASDAVAPPPRPRPGLEREPRARASTASPRRSACTWSSRSRRPARFARRDRPADRARPAQPRRARLRRACASPDALHLPHPLGDPAVRRARVERGGVRRRASWPPTTCSSSTTTCSRCATSSRATPTTSPRRCSAASSSAPTGRPARFDPPDGPRGARRRPGDAVRTKQARAALPAEVPMADAVFNIAHGALLALGLAQGDFDLVARGLDDRLHQPRREHLYPRSMELVRRAPELGALGATISGAGPTVLVWCHYEQTAGVVEAPAPRVRRLGRASCARRSRPQGADVREL